MPGVLKSPRFLLLDYIFNFTSHSVHLSERCRREMELNSILVSNRLSFNMADFDLNEEEKNVVKEAIDVFAVEEPMDLVIYVSTSFSYVVLHLRTLPDLHKTLLNNPHLRFCK